MSKSPASAIHIGLSSWIIQDGNYGDFTAGEQTKFALEFAALDDLKTAVNGPLMAKHLGASRYRVRARVAFVADRAVVIDADDFMAFCTQPLEGAQLGAFVEGNVYLGIDPFFYFENLHAVPGMPPLSYRWIVREIRLETTPWRDSRLPDGTRLRERDDSQESYAAVSATHAWEDDDGNAHYVLSCAREGEPEPP